MMTAAQAQHQSVIMTAAATDNETRSLRLCKSPRSSKSQTDCRLRSKNPAAHEKAAKKTNEPQRIKKGIYYARRN